MLNLFLLAATAAVLAVGLALVLILIRLRRTLDSAELLLRAITNEVERTLPEIRQSLATVNELTATATLGLQTAGTGVEWVGHRLERGRRRVWIEVSVAGAAVAAAARALTARPPGANPELEGGRGRRFENISSREQED